MLVSYIIVIKSNYDRREIFIFILLNISSFAIKLLVKYGKIR
jgi:hypothetical protein